MISKKILDCIENSPEFMSSIKLDVLKDILKEADDRYYNDKEPLLSDIVYDRMREYVLSKDKTYSNQQHSNIQVKGDDKVKLPVWLGSMTKKKSVSNETNVVVSDKLDGISCLVDKTGNSIKLYTRGNGTIGRDITRLIEYIQGIDMNMKDKVMVRGELIMTKKVFDEIKEEESNPRNTVAGFVNSKVPKQKYANKIDFVCYEVIVPENLSPSEQFAYVKKNTTFTPVHYEKFSSITKANLSTLLNTRKSKSNYEIDGIIVAKDEKYDYIKEGNPKHAFAYKENSQENHKKTTVVKVEWNISKDKYVKPIIHVKQVCINNVCIKKTTGYNAKYIFDNKIGEGTEITIERSGDVIPKIVSIDKPTIADMPTYKYKWNDTGVDIMVVDDDENVVDEINKKSFVNMVDKMGITGMGKTTIVKLYDNGISTLKDLYNMTEKDLLGLEGFSNKSAKSLIDAIQDKKHNLKCIDYMVASNCFGRGFASKVFAVILAKYSIYKDVSVEELENLEGIGKLKAKGYIDGLVKFRSFLEANAIEDVCMQNATTSHQLTGNDKGLYKNKKILFTGFRDKDLIKFINKEGGEVVDGAITKKIDLVLFKDSNKSSSKLEKAKEYGIYMLNVEDFKKNNGLL